MNLRERIVSDPDILLGKPAVQGTRISVSFILYLLAGGWSESDITAEYPHLTVEDIRACCLYASENLVWEKPDWYRDNDFLEGDEWVWVKGGPLSAPESAPDNAGTSDAIRHR